MTAMLTAEWHKLTTVRTFRWLMVGVAVVAVVTTVSTVSAANQPPWHMANPLHEQMAWFLTTVNGSIFAMIVGARTFTDEYRHSTIAHTYIADPRRTTTMVAKAGAAALAGTLIGALQTVSLLLVTVLMTLSSAGEVAVHRADIAPAVGMLVAMAMWAVIGASLGAIMRNQVGVVAAVLVWNLLLENLGAGLLEGAGRFLPGQTVHAIAQTSEAIGLLGIGPAILLMAGYTAAFVGAGLAITRRRDIT